MARALLVIDVQNIYTDKNSELYCKDSAKTVGRINDLIARFESEKETIVYVRHVHKKDGSDLGRMFDYLGEAEDFNFKEGTSDVKYDSRLKLTKKRLELTKNRYSAFAGTSLEAQLRKASIDTVVICGFMSNFCCESTAREAHDKDYYVDYIVDATGTPGTDNFDEKALRKSIADVMVAGIARVSTTKNFLKK